MLNPLAVFTRLLDHVRCLPPGGIQAGQGVRIHRPHGRISAGEEIMIGDRTVVGANALILPVREYAGVRYQPRISIGKDVYIGPNLYMVCAGSITLGDGCVLSESVFLNDNGHGLDPEGGLIMQQRLTQPRSIVIGKSCFLGLRSAVMPGVTLGDHCVVGINAVVTKSFPAYSMVAGAPAQLVRRYSLERREWVVPGAAETA